MRTMPLSRSLLTDCDDSFHKPSTAARCGQPRSTPELDFSCDLFHFDNPHFLGPSTKTVARKFSCKKEAKRRSLDVENMASALLKLRNM